MELIEKQHGGAIVARRTRRFQLRTGRPRKPKPVESSAPASDAGGGNYAVRVLDNPRNTYEEVIHICMLALDCSVEAAYAIALEIDHQGSAVVLEADRKTAEQVAEIIGTIGIEVKVEPLGAQ